MIPEIMEKFGRALAIACYDLGDNPIIIKRSLDYIDEHFSTSHNEDDTQMRLIANSILDGYIAQNNKQRPIDSESRL